MSEALGVRREQAKDAEASATAVADGGEDDVFGEVLLDDLEASTTDGGDVA